MKLAKDNFDEIDKQQIGRLCSSMTNEDFKGYCLDIINRGRSVGKKKQGFIDAIETNKSNDKMKNLKVIYNYWMAGEGLGVV